MVESVKDKGVTQPAIVRPREGGGYEMVSGHRRQMASELAGFTNMPCVVRNLTDDEAITQMVEDNTNQRGKFCRVKRQKPLIGWNPSGTVVSTLVTRGLWCYALFLLQGSFELSL